MSENKVDVIVLGKDYNEDEYEITYKCQHDKDGRKKYMFNIKRTKENKEEQSKGESCDTCAHKKKNPFASPCKICSCNSFSFSTVQNSCWELGKEKQNDDNNVR